MSESRNRELEAYYLLWAAAFLLWEAAVQQAVVGEFRFWPDAGFCLAAAALGSREPVTVTDAWSIRKSYPKFFTDFESLGGKAHVV